MTPLRQRMLEDMRIRNFSPTTQETYLRHVAYLARHFGKSPDLLGPQELRVYQVYLVEYKGASAAVRGQTVSALRFCYGVTLGKPWSVEAIPHPRVPQKLPIVLGREDVATFLAAATNPKHRALLTIIYACGLRCSEAIRLRLTDIDSKRMVLCVGLAKGAKDRMVMLSPRLLVLPREYWKEFRPQFWLFPGQSGERPLLDASARWVSCRPGFFLPVRVLSRLFRGLFLGGLQNRHREEKLRRARALLGAPAAQPKPEAETSDWKDFHTKLTGEDLHRCPACGQGRLVHLGLLPPDREAIFPWQAAEGIDSS